MTSTSTDGTSTGTTGPVGTDPWAHPVAQEAAAARAAQDGPRLRALLADPDPVRAVFLTGVVSTADDAVALVAGARVGEDDPVVDALRARHHVELAWRSRTAARARDVSAEQFERFFTELRTAERLLVDLSVRHPSDVVAWETRLTTARGLELGQHEARRRYDRLAALVPHHYLAQQTYLQQVVPKWGGSWAAAESFVAECAQDAPAGSPSRGLRADLLVERWAEDGVDVLDDARVADLRRVACETVLHEDAVPGPDTDELHAQLALLFHLAGRPEDAAPHFRALDARPVTGGWLYLASPEQTYEQARAAALGLPRPTLPRGTSARRAVLRVVRVASIAFLAVMAVLLGAGVLATSTAALRGEPGSVVTLVVCVAGLGLCGWYLFDALRPTRSRRRKR